MRRKGYTALEGISCRRLSWANLLKKEYLKFSTKMWLRVLLLPFVFEGLCFGFIIRDFRTVLYAYPEKPRNTWIWWVKVIFKVNLKGLGSERRIIHIYWEVGRKRCLSANESGFLNFSICVAKVSTEFLNFIVTKQNNFSLKTIFIWSCCFYLWILTSWGNSCGNWSSWKASMCTRNLRKCLSSLKSETGGS